MAANVWIDKLRFKNGTDLSLDQNSIVVFVGPNNGGKSTALKEIGFGPHAYNSQSRYVIDEITVSVTGSKDEGAEKMKSRRIGDHYYLVDKLNIHNIYSTSYPDFLQNWDRAVAGDPHAHGYLLQYFLNELKTKDRLNLVEPAINIDTYEHAYHNPIQLIKADEKKEKMFSDYFRNAFGQDVIINHSAGQKIPLHVGTRPNVTAEEDRVSSSYQIALRKLPYLHEQGDGMKSFAGVFLSLFAEDYTINIIDEPEAFLHPPQAVLLGQMMGRELDPNKQLFIATHSEHLLKGLLDVAMDRITVVRIQRQDINMLDNNELQTIAKDSLLRYTNILDGLFHKRVILVESDSDCKFYNAMSNAIAASKGLQSPDLLFVQTGGKHRFPVVIKALVKLGVPITVIGDFDFYHEESPAKPSFEQLGGSWNLVQQDFLIVKRSIDNKRPELETVDLKVEIERIFDSIHDRVMPESKIKDIQKALKKSSAWTQAKQSGRAYLPQGDETKAFNNVQRAFAEKGLHILDIGEIEAFDKTVGNHGPTWVNAVLQKDLLTDPDLQQARDFVEKVILS